MQEVSFISFIPFPEDLQQSEEDSDYICVEFSCSPDVVIKVYSFLTIAQNELGIDQQVQTIDYGEAYR